MLTPTDVLYPHGPGDDLVIADVDWATGIVRMHISYNEWEQLLGHLGPDPSTLTLDERYMTEVLTHEGMHVLQMITTGYAYELSLQCFEQVLGAIEAYGNLTDIYAARQSYTAALEPVFMALAEPGNSGVRAIDILESAAFLVQKRTHYPACGPQAYEYMLDHQVPDAAYRRAYDVATDVLGEDAFDQFVHIATLALQTREPQTVFVPLLKAFRLEGSRINIEHNHQVGIRMLNSRFADLLLGSSFDRLAEGRLHPCLAGIVNELNHLLHRGEVSLFELMVHPHRINQQAANLLARPMLFPPPAGRRTGSTTRSTVAYIPPAWDARAGDDPLMDPTLLRLLSATSALVVMDIEPAPLERPKSRPARAGYDTAIESRIWEFSRVNLTEATADRLAENLQKIEEDASKARALRGTVMIAFPDDEHVGSPYLDLEVRRFMFGLYERIPHLLYYLTDLDVAGSMLACVASHAFADGVVPSEGENGTVSVEIGPNTLRLLFGRIQEAAAFARRMGDDSHFLLGHLRGIEPMMRDFLALPVVNSY